MNTLERWYLSFMHKEPDQVPVMIDPFPLKGFSTRVHVKDYLIDHTSYSSPKRLKYELSFLEHFPDVIPLEFSPSYPGLVWGSIFGAKARITKEGADLPIPAFKTIEEIEKLYVPDPHSNEKLQKELETLRYYMKNVPIELRERLGILDNWVSIAGVEGAVTSGLVNYEQFLVGIRLHPDMIHRLNEMVIQFNIEWAKAVEEIVGKLTKILLCDHSPTFMSKSQFEEFFLPYIREIRRCFPYAIIIYHNEGKMNHLLSEIPSMLVDAFHLGPDTDIKKAKEIIGDKITLIGNIDPIDVLLRGSPEDVIRACKEVINKAARGGGLILSTGGGPPRALTPLKNFEAMLLAVKKFGNYSRFDQ